MMGGLSLDEATLNKNGHPAAGMLLEGALVCRAVGRKDLIFDRLISRSRMLPYGRDLTVLHNCRLIRSLEGNPSAHRHDTANAKRSNH